MILGIDPGINGALAIVDQIGDLQFASAFPKNPDGLHLSALIHLIGEIAVRYGVLSVWLEEPHAIFGASARSTFQFGRGIGQIECAITAAGLPYKRVSPLKWTRALHVDLDRSQTAKQRSYAKALELWGSEGLRLFGRKERVTKSTNRVIVTPPHDGMIDAALIAYWGLKHGV